MASASDEQRIFNAPSPNTNNWGGRDGAARMPWAQCGAMVWRRRVRRICGYIDRGLQRCERCNQSFCRRHIRRVWHREDPAVEEHGEGSCMGWGMGSIACLGRWGACSSGDGNQLRSSAGWHTAVLYHVLHGMPAARPRCGGGAGTMRRACTHSSGYMYINIQYIIYNI